jgi:hypothetical protein
VKSKVILLPMSNLTPLKDLAASLEGTLYMMTFIKHCMPQMRLRIELCQLL